MSSSSTYAAGRRLALCGAIIGACATACASRDSGEADTVATWTISAEPALSIGELDGPDPYLFQQVVDALLLPDGRIVVADGGIGVIRVFAADGRFLAEMGGSGEGPGEYSSLSAIFLIPPDTIGAFDPRLMRVDRHLTDGSLIAVRQLGLPGQGQVPGGTLQVFVGAFEDGGIAAGWLAAGGRLEPGVVVADRFPIGRFGADGAFEGLILDATFFERAMFDERAGGPVPYTPVPYAAVFGDSLYYADGLRPEVSVRGRDGVEGRAIGVPASPHDVDAAFAALEPQLADTGVFYTVEQLRAVPRPDAIPVVAGLQVDDGGNVWVRRFDVPDDALWNGGGIYRFGGTWWVFDSTGEPVATAEVPGSLRILDIRGDRIVGLQLDKMDVQRIVVHAIDR